MMYLRLTKTRARTKSETTKTKFQVKTKMHMVTEKRKETMKRRKPGIIDPKYGFTDETKPANKGDKMFISYTISEDRCGSQNDFVSSRLAALGDRGRLRDEKAQGALSR